MQNEHVLTLALTHLGTRVTIQTLEVHIESFYTLMNVPIPRALTLHFNFFSNLYSLVIVCVLFGMV